MPVFDIHADLGGSVIPGVANNAAAVTAEMKACGIDRRVLLSAHARNVDPLAGNRILKAMLDQSPSLYGCILTHVNRLDSSVTVMRELMSNRKFLAMAISGTSTKEPVQKLVADELINAYRRYSKPLFLFTPTGDCVHAGLEIAKAYSMIKIVFIGMGGTDWRHAIAAAESSTNILLESSGPLDRSKLPAAVNAIGSHRVLFGSGAPHCDGAAALGLIEDSALTDEARRRILYDNAIKLFALEE